DLLLRGRARRKRFGRDVEYFSARLADEVMVRGGVGIEPLSVTEPHVSAELRLREHVERLVDGREAHRRKIGTQALEQILRGRVRRIVRERFHDGETLRREAHARALELADHPFDLLVTDHDAENLTDKLYPLQVILHRGCIDPYRMVWVAI